MSSLIFLSLLSLSANAQDAYNAHGFALAPDDGDLHDMLSVWRAEAQVPRSVAVTGVAEYASNPLTLHEYGPNGWSESELLDQLLGVNFGGTFSLHERMSVAASLPVWMSVTGSDGARAQALGDLRIYAPIGVILPDAEEGGFGLSLVPTLSAPTGDSSMYLGAGGVGYGGVVAATYQADRWQLSGNAGVNQTPEVEAMNLQGGPFAHLAVGGSFAVNESLALRAEVVADHAIGGNEVRGTESPVEALFTARARTSSGLSLTAGGAKGLTQGAGAAEFRLFAGVGWTGGKDDQAPVEALDATLIVQVQDPEGQPLEEALVSMDGVSLHTGPDGVVRWDDLSPEGRPFLTASAEDFHSAVVDDLVLREGINRQVVVLDPETGELRVIAIDNAGESVDARVRFLEGPEHQAMATLGDDGEERFELTPGDWELLVVAEGFAPKTARVELDPSELETVKVVFDRDELDISGGVLVLHDVLFNFDEDTLRPDALPILTDVANTLRDHPEFSLVEVQGHCDTMGSHEYNDDLSHRRARRVTAFLVDQGVPAERLFFQGYGERELMVDTPDNTREQMNRRVVFQVMDAPVADVD